MACALKLLKQETGRRGIGGLAEVTCVTACRAADTRRFWGRVFQAGETANTKPQDGAELSWCVGEQRGSVWTELSEQGEGCSR